MKRKQSETPSRIYSYGALRPVEGVDLVEDQFRRARAYQNDLIAIERARRAARRATYREHSALAVPAATVEAREVAVEGLRQVLRDKRAGAGRRAETAVEEAAVRKALEALWETERALGEAVKVVAERIRVAIVVDAEALAAQAALDRLRKSKAEGGEGCGPRSPGRAAAKRRLMEARAAALDRALREDRISLADRALARTLDLIEDRAADLVRRSRAVSGLTPGTYLLVEKAVEAARGKPGMPHFRTVEDGGRIGVHFGGGGILIADLLAGKSCSLRIGPPPPHVPSLRERRGEAPRKVRETDRTAQIRVGSKGREPIWAAFPIVLHRPFPDPGRVKDAWILRRRIGLRWEYRLQIAIESEAFRPPEKPVGRGTVAINLGWRNLSDGGVRVGYLVDDGGHEEDLRLPVVTGRDQHGVRFARPLPEAIEKVHELQAIRDTHFDVARTFLVSWLALEAGLPAWIVDRTRTLSRWRSARRLAGLLATWTKQRFARDEATFSALLAWAKQDRHLLAWASHQRDRRIGHRREFWRVLAARLARTYAVILVDEMDLRDFLQAPLPEDGVPSDGKPQRKTARLAAPGEGREEIRRAGKKYGAEVVFDDGTYASQVHAGPPVCAACGVALIGDRRSQVQLACPTCRVAVDQDANNCQNRLRWYASGGAPRPAGGLLAGGKPSKGKVKSGTKAAACVDP